eukprot:34673-Eustigmatos_ZCMA.PRE.1
MRPHMRRSGPSIRQAAIRSGASAAAYQPHKACCMILGDQKQTCRQTEREEEGVESEQGHV